MFKLYLLEQFFNILSLNLFTVLITDGISTTDPTPQANEMKQNGNVVFTIGIADYQEDQLLPLASVSENGVPDFFGISSFEVFNKLSQYLKESKCSSILCHFCKHILFRKGHYNKGLF